MKNTKKKILIAEDEISLANALEKKFLEANFEVFVVHNGDDAVKIAFAEHPDLVLLDIIMPKKDGMTALKEIKVDKWGKEVPVILLTNLSDKEKVEDAIEYGVYDYLVKSDWKLSDVVKKVQEKLDIDDK
jgi:DNA-binding response OmpR family regulator